MPKLSFELEGTARSVELTEDTHEMITGGSALRGRPVEYYLARVVTLYGDLTEENILKYMDEHWIL